jgi:hypothetical protein
MTSTARRRPARVLRDGLLLVKGVRVGLAVGVLPLSAAAASGMAVVPIAARRYSTMFSALAGLIRRQAGTSRVREA